MKVSRLIKVDKQNGMVDVIGLRLICDGNEQNEVLNMLLSDGRLLKSVPYDISIRDAMLSGLIYLFRYTSKEDVDIELKGYIKGRSLKNALLQMSLSKALGYDKGEYNTTSKDFKGWLCILALYGEKRFLSKPLKEQVALYNVATKVMGRNRARGVQIKDGSKVKFKYFTHNAILEESTKVGVNASALHMLLHYLAIYRGYLLVGDCTLTNSVFAEWYNDGRFVINNLNIEDESDLGVSLAVLYA